MIMLMVINQSVFAHEGCVSVLMRHVEIVHTADPLRRPVIVVVFSALHNNIRPKLFVYDFVIVFRHLYM
jgi:hypothetical protein